ncbi:MAG: hypothetical protein ABI665_05230 [Vicinamibacterales bacterium]
MKRFGASPHPSQEIHVTDAELRAYLLGQSPQADSVRIEERLLEDEEAFEVARSVEDDLFDDYARHRLNATEREQFIARYGAQAARLTFASALARRSQRPASILRFVPRVWIPLAAAAMLAIAVGGVLRSRQDPPAVSTPVSQAVTPPAPMIVALSLGTSRAAGDITQIALRPDVSMLQLRVRLDPADRYDRYAMTLRSSSGNVVWDGRDLQPSIDRGESIVAATMAATAIADGSYELAVEGVNPSRAPEALGFVTVKVTRTR